MSSWNCLRRLTCYSLLPEEEAVGMNRFFSASREVSASLCCSPMCSAVQEIRDRKNFPNNFPAHSLFSAPDDLRLDEFCQEVDPAHMPCPLQSLAHSQLSSPALVSHSLL